MEKKYIIIILVIILLIILIKFTNCNENFELNIISKPLTTNYLNSLYTLIKMDNIVILTNFNENSEYSKLYEYKNIFNEKYFNIYLNNAILKYINGDKINFYLDSADNIVAFSENYRLYKTSDNKLYFKINNENKYLSIKINTNILSLSNNIQDALIWNL